MTGPHMFDGVSHPPKRVVPVDTTELKGNIAKDSAAAAQVTKVADSYPPKTIADELTLRDASNIMSKSAKARSDTLAQVRSGKIPAKKGG